jgi:hypothetical protein
VDRPAPSHQDSGTGLPVGADVGAATGTGAASSSSGLDTATDRTVAQLMQWSSQQVAVDRQHPGGEAGQLDDLDAGPGQQLGAVAVGEQRRLP